MANQTQTTFTCPNCHKLHHWDHDQDTILETKELEPTDTITQYVCKCGATVALVVARAVGDYMGLNFYVPE